MLQAIVKKGRVLPVEVPAPTVSPGSVFIKVVNSCISAGTEMSGVAATGKSLIQRAIEQPENVKKALNMVRSDGIAATYKKIMGRLEAGSPTGYSLSGIVIAVGKGVNDLHPGDRVAAAGAGIANHAEYVDVPRNLVIQIPENIDFAPASTVALGGIAMQGIRRTKAEIGEFVVVFGTGVLGQLAIQMLAVSGVRVIAVDFDQKRLEMAKKMGAEVTYNPRKHNSVKSVFHYTEAHGADAVLFCAATNDPQALSDGFAMTRKKGRLIMVGVWGKELRRENIYNKELDFLISTSYGPGRYDENYEQRGFDYPYDYVRWTENRNMEEYLRLLASDKVNVDPLIQDIYSIDQVEKAFQTLQNPIKPLIILLDYGKDLPDDYSCLKAQSNRTENKISYRPISGKRIRVGIIGAGGFAVGTHLPNLKKLNDKYEIRAICNRTGSKAQMVAQQFGARYSTTDYREILKDPDIDLVMICTRHNLHGTMVLESLQSGKHTFVEKPLCTNHKELQSIKDFYGFNLDNAQSNNLSNVQPLLMVGFNRRFSKYIQEVKKHVHNRTSPLFIHYRMNAGYISLDHWVHTEEGGGRIIGEACHIIDLFSHLVESSVKTYACACLKPIIRSISSSDNKSIIVEYEDGSAATLEYFAIGSKELSKERLEVHFDEKSIIVDDYRSIEGYNLQIKKIKSNFSEKGLFEELLEIRKCLRNEKKGWPIDLASLVETTELTFAIK